MTAFANPSYRKTKYRQICSIRNVDNEECILAFLLMEAKKENNYGREQRIQRKEATRGSERT